MRKFLILLLPLLLSSAMLKVGDKIDAVELESQREVKYSLVKNGVWVVTWDKQSTRIANRHFIENGMPKDVNMLVDVSQIPSGILNAFVIPKMRRYEHDMLLSHDENYNLTLAYEDGALTLIYVKDSIINKILFVKNQEELKAALE